MAETEQDRRAGLLVLVSHTLLNGPGRVRASGGLVDWAHRNDWGIYQLPEPLHLIDARAAGTREGAAEDRELLDGVFTQLRTYLDHDYRLAGAVLATAEVEGAPGRAWLAQVAASAGEADVPVGPAWLVPADLEPWRTPPRVELGALLGAGQLP